MKGKGGKRIHETNMKPSVRTPPISILVLYFLMNKKGITKAYHGIKNTIGMIDLPYIYS